MPSPLGLPGVLLSIALGGLFFLISSFSSDSGLFWLAAAAPLPVLWAYLRRGAPAGLVAALSGGAAYLLLVGPERGIITGLLVAGVQGLLPALMMGAALAAGGTAGVAITAGTSGHVGAQVMLLALLKQQLKSDPVSLLSAGARESAAQMPPALMAALGMDSAAFAGFMEQMIQLLWPALFVMGAFMSIAVTYLLARVLFPRLGCELPPITPMGQWRLPVLLGWAWLLALISRGFGDFGERIGSNVLVILAAAYWLQGLSVGHYFLSLRIPKPISGVVVALAGLPAMWIVTLVGVSDAVFNFRRLGQGQPDRSDSP